jgi:broad-specificity NMP kinase
LVTGGSCTGKSTVCRELERRGVRTVDGDRDIAYQGDPATGAPVAPRHDERPSHWKHRWDVERARELATRDSGVTVFCGDARNLDAVTDMFDVVVVLHIDAETLRRRLDRRPTDEFGSTPEERALVLRLHRVADRWPQDAIVIDATQPVEVVVDEILALT